MKAKALPVWAPWVEGGGFVLDRVLNRQIAVNQIHPLVDAKIPETPHGICGPFGEESMVRVVSLQEKLGQVATFILTGDSGYQSCSACSQIRPPRGEVPASRLSSV